MGPILFIIYINNPVSTANLCWTNALFVDDSPFIVSVKNWNDIENTHGNRE